MRISPRIRQSRLTCVKKKLTLTLVTLGSDKSNAIAGEAPKKNVRPACVRQHNGRTHQTTMLKIAATAPISVARIAGIEADGDVGKRNPTRTKTNPISMASLKHQISHSCRSQ